MIIHDASFCVYILRSGKGKIPLDLSKMGKYDENHISNLVSISHIVKE